MSSCKLVGILLLCCLITACGESTAGRNYVLTTGNTGGTFYPVGVALSTIASARADAAFSLTAISSAGSMENIKLLRDGQAQFALILGVFAAWAWDGSGPISSSQTHLRGISAMWPNVEHFILHSSLVQDGTIADLGRLDGARYSIGMRNSGAEQTGFYIFDALGIDHDRDLSIAWMGYGPSADALRNGNIVGMNIPAGAPVAAVTRAWALLGEEMTILNFSAGQIAAINHEFPLWQTHELPPGTYPSQRRSVFTAASSNVLVVHEDVDAETVYELTAMLWDNLPTLQEIHGATRSMSLDNALTGMPVPLHPGAVRFYNERGLAIPTDLLPGD